MFKRVHTLLLLIAAIFLANNLVQAQRDTLILNNNDMIVGEMKTLTKGVLTFKTPYSDSDFKIEWKGVKEVYPSNYYLIHLTNGAHLNGTFRTLRNDTIVIFPAVGNFIPTTLSEIVYINRVKKKFWDRIDFNTDVGFTFTKANNLRQFIISSSLGYTEDRWATTIRYDDNSSEQDSLARNRRSETNIGFHYSFRDSWIFIQSLNFLSNTQQALSLRTSGRTGMGQFLLENHYMDWLASGGFSYLNENFSNETESRNSLELFLSSQLDVFDAKDFRILFNITAFPSLTERRRFRVDSKIDTKYDLFDDFYIKLSGSMNYDNRPAIQGNELDYVISASFGWEL